nr:unnamed protein product [Spirometra erinaceieuropaei]
MPPVYQDYSRSHEVTVGELYMAARPPTSRGKENIPSRKEKTGYAPGNPPRNSSKKPQRNQKLDQRLEERTRKVSAKNIYSNGNVSNGQSTVKRTQKKTNSSLKNKPANALQDTALRPGSSVSSRDDASLFFSNVKEFQKCKNPPGQRKGDSGNIFNNDLLYQQSAAQKNRMGSERSTVRSYNSDGSNDTGTYQEVRRTGVKDFPLTASTLSLLPTATPSKSFVPLAPTEWTVEKPGRPLQTLSNTSCEHDDLYEFREKDYIVPRNTKPIPFPYDSPTAGVTAKEDKTNAPKTLMNRPLIQTPHQLQFPPEALKPPVTNLYSGASKEARKAISFPSNLNMVSASKRKTVIIDVGNYFVRAGILRNQPAPPEVCFPTVTSFRSPSKADLSNTAVEPSTNRSIAVGEKVYKTLFSETTAQQRLVFPLRQRQMGEATTKENPDIETSILREVFAKLHIDPAEYKVLLTLPTRASALRPNFLVSLFSEFGVPAVAIMSAFRASLQTAKTSTCLVINLGCDLEILPVYQGSLIEGGRCLVGQFGENIVNTMLANLIDAGVITTKEETLCFSQYIFQRAAFVENNSTACEDIEIDLSEFVHAPTKNIRISADLRKVSTEGIFKPSKTKYFDPNAPSLTKLLRQSLKACPIESRQDLCTNVLLVGEYANLEGLQHRILSEMQRFLPKNTFLAVKTVPNSAEAAYIGGCLTCAIMQGPKAPECSWFRFMEPARWNLIKASAPSGTRLVDRLNAEMCWP